MTSETSTAIGDRAADPRWRILIVEDSVDDAELIRLELREGEIDAEYRLVDSETGLMNELQSFAPHLVLSDMNLPGFSGEHAIELVREHAPGIRFIFLSGSSHGGDPALMGELAADALLSKDDLAQLPALVRKLLG